MVRERRMLPLTDGKMTTLTVRAREQAIERRAQALAQPAGRDVGHTARTNAARQVAERLGAPLTDEQELALMVLTGPERGAALIGPAGAGKGVVIDAAARAEQLAGHTTLGIAVADATAERLGTDSPALKGQTMTVNELLARAQHGSITLDPHTTVIFDEAGIGDTKRLHALTGLIERAGAKLIAVGDGKQLPSIGPGGMFDVLTTRMPVVELQEVRRTLDPEEQRAWAALRDGRPELAIAHYHARGQLHFTDTRDQAAEQAVQSWAKLTETHDISQVALIADASNLEIGRLNAHAQHLRAQRGELGNTSCHSNPSTTACAKETAWRSSPNTTSAGYPRVENGTRGEITKLHGRPDHHDRRQRPTGHTHRRTDRATAPRLRRPRLPPTGRNRRARRDPHRRLALIPRGRLRRGFPRPPRHPMARSTRRPRHRRQRRATNRTPLPTHARKPRTNTLAHPRDRASASHTRPRPPRSARSWPLNDRLRPRNDENVLRRRKTA